MPECTVPTVQFRGERLMVCGCLFMVRLGAVVSPRQFCVSNFAAIVWGRPFLVSA